MTAFGNYRWTSTAKAKEPVNYLFEYINLNYPQIDLGYSWDKDKVYLKNQSLIRKLFERSCRHDSFKKWADLNQKYNSLKLKM